MKRALITNDDGIESVGLALLAQAAVQAGFAVTVAAPHKEASGSSASLSALASGGRLLMEQRQLADLDGVPAYAVQASPALIAFVALRGAFGDPPDVVLSGINHGPNTGQAVLHSGTVGAALTAASHGASALAVSLATAQAEHWDTAADAAKRVVAWYSSRAEPGRVVNVNVPDIPPERFRGFRSSNLAAFGAVQANIGDRQEGAVAVTFAEPEDDPEEGTDVAALRGGFASVTLLAAPCEVTPPDVSELG